MKTLGRVGLGAAVLLSAPMALIDCFGSSASKPAVDASFDVSTQETGFPEAGDDVSQDVTFPVDSSTPVDGSTADVQDAQAPVDATPEADAEAGPPVVEVLGQGLADPIILATSATHLYFLESATPADDSGYTGGVRRCPIAGCGGNAPEVVVPSAVIPGGMAISGSTLFWSDSFQHIFTCDVTTVPCTATTLTSILDDAGGGAFPTQFWAYGANIYWMVQFGSDRVIQTCPVTGCSAGYPKTVLYGGTGSALSGTSTGGLAIDGSYAYVSLFSGGPILRYTMTTPESADIASETQLAMTPSGTHDLDLDGVTLRWAEVVVPDGGPGNRVAGCTLPGCASTFDVATGRTTPYAVRHDATYVYGVDQGVGIYGGVLWRLHK